VEEQEEALQLQSFLALLLQLLVPEEQLERHQEVLQEQVALAVLVLYSYIGKEK
jgi:hypothetical protein